MDPSFARTYYESAARNHWWFRGRAELVSGLLSRHETKPRTALDIGAGSATLFPSSIDVVKADIVIPDRPSEGFVVASATNLPFRDENFEAAGLFDVVEHLEDPVEALVEARRVVTSTGCLIITVPAHERLWSEHDVVVGHLTRYDEPRLRDLLLEAGWQPVWMTYFYAFLLPAAVIRKAVRSATGMSLPPKWVNRPLAEVAVRSARRAVRSQSKWGLSIGAVAVRSSLIR